MYHFVVNPAARSGHGMAVWEQVRPVLEARNIPYKVYCSEKKGDITRLVREITSADASAESDGPIRLVIVGGDGTLNEAVQGVADFDKLLLGYIPAGSANDFAVNTGISQNPLSALEQILCCAEPTRYDVGYMTYDDAPDPAERHYFTSSCGIGYDAEVSRVAMVSTSTSKNLLNKLGMGDLIFLLDAIKTLAGVKRGDCTMTLDDDRVVSIPQFLFVCSMIYRYEGGGFLFSPDADPCDGKLDVCSFGYMPKWKVLLAFPAGYKGTHYRFQNVEPYRAGKVHIHTSMPFWVQLDGEVATQSADISIYCDQKRLRLLK